MARTKRKHGLHDADDRCTVCKRKRRVVAAWYDPDGFRHDRKPCTTADGKHVWVAKEATK